MTSGLHIELITTPLTSAQRAEIEHLANTAETHDGAAAFNEQSYVELDKPQPQFLIALARSDADFRQAPGGQASPRQAPGQQCPTEYAGSAQLLGAGVVVLGDPVDEPDVLELVVHPNHRRAGIATQLAQTLRQATADRSRAQRAWAHGGHPGAPALAEHFGWSPARELWQMRLENDVALSSCQLPDGITLRSFRPGHDDQAWLRLNASAFADHPEQGRLTQEDLDARVNAEWFSAEGFLLAVEGSHEGEQLLGFHWTKIHQQEDGQRIGEVYVVGVAPEAQGRGLGKILTVAGINYLRGTGVDAVILYVDAANEAAATLYQRLGFTVAHTDRQYQP